MKNNPDAKRFSRYQTVIKVLTTKDSFCKPDIYAVLKDEEKAKWLELIRRHLTKTLLMEKDDVDYMPIFTREGGSWGKLNKVFGGELDAVIHEINTAIAA